MAARSFNSADRSVRRVHPLTRRAAHDQPAIRSSLKPRLVAFTPNAAEAVRCAGGWLFDQVLAGWDVTVVAAAAGDPRPLRILGVRTYDLDSAMTFPVRGACLDAMAVQAELAESDDWVRGLVHTATEAGQTEIRFWGDSWPDGFDSDPDPLSHRLSVAARAFKTQALAAAAVPAEPAAAATEVFWRAESRRLGLVSAR